MGFVYFAIVDLPFPSERVFAAYRCSFAIKVDDSERFASVLHVWRYLQWLFDAINAFSQAYCDTAVGRFADRKGFGDGAYSQF